MDNVTIFGQVDKDLRATVELLRKRNVAVTIRDERELNAMRIRQENLRQQELTQQRQRANATRKESHKLSSSDKGKEKVIYAKKKQATLVQPLRERNVGVQIREVRDMNVTGVREENERAETLARDNQGSSSTAKGKGKENARV
ncbi:hypothetical protein Vadar_017637 [Vaccinium darrowii]|uniref:Uncharacterized protein n=1 Tax=Vaccinium darrowii TaxID=229202 RepID=A0ACB7ZCW4_9ERIC|nr:hypothetical protein Vadar_017637 [Vaccinium darrowii]